MQAGRHAGALDAVRDVIGWNTVWDGANRRPYTSLSRNWVAQKFGGWGVWLNDVLYHGLMAGLFDTEIARENLAAVFAGATPAGNLPCLLTGRDSWVDRSQPPIGAFIVWLLYLRTPRPAHPERELRRARPQPRLVVADARRQRRRPRRVRHLAGGRGALPRHQARRQGRVEHGQFAYP